MSKPIDHKSVCPGDRICIECGRRVCKNCSVTKENIDSYKGYRTTLGICIICSGMYEEGELILYKPTPEWDEEKN